MINELELVRWSMWKGYGNWEKHTPFVQCMPEKYRELDPVTAYRAFYVGEKARFAKWAPHADAPAWWPFEES